MKTDKRGLCLALLHICEDEHQETIDELGMDPFLTGRGDGSTDFNAFTWERGVEFGKQAFQLRSMLQTIDARAERDQHTAIRERALQKKLDRVKGAKP